MFQALLNFILNLIMKLYQLLITPVILLIQGLFPSVSEYFEHITEFLNIVANYADFVVDITFLPKTAILLLFDYMLIKSTISLGIQGFRAFLNLYKTFKL